MVGVIAEHRRFAEDANYLAFALKPCLLLLEEPPSGVSAPEWFPLMEALMGALREQQVTALFVEHDMSVVERFAKRGVVWKSGNIMAEGTSYELCKTPTRCIRWRAFPDAQHKRPGDID